MIEVKAIEPDTAEWKKWRSRCDKETLLLIKANNTGQTLKIRGDLYKEQKNEYYFNKIGPFHGKCAYCEAYLTPNQQGDIDHYRPKAAVRNLDNIRVKINLGGKSSDHPGYYWLTYDWRNLLPSCILCNRFSNNVNGQFVGKGERFPVERDKYATRPNEESNETPLLLNPTLDNPAEHLSFDKSTGLITWQSQRGKITCEVLGLNKFCRHEMRKKVFDDITIKMGFYFMAKTQRQAVPETIKKSIETIKEGGDEYTMAARAAIDNFLGTMRDL